MALSRRQMLVGGAAGGGLLLAWGLMPRHYPLPLPPAPGEVAFDAWLRIGADGMVTVAIPQLEMGQGVLTVLAQVVAMELGADWRQVAVQMAPVSEIWANVPLARRWAPMWMPFWPGLADGEDGLLARRWAERHRFMATADGQSLAAYEAPARHAAACARGMLAQAAARRWGVEAGQCRVEKGLISHGAQSLPFGALAAEAARLTPPDPPPLRAQPPAQDPALRDAGGFPRLDLPAKVDGSWPFAADIRLPGMVFAAIRNAPRGQA
ncbi:MAG TPA: molybdopterin cofactor-binding domain-containing protein, partial [Novosphingobium sp.]|nr:molybdopterin cofactor-binding domain-containing protein [Novosphingobium sp.]